MVDGSHGDLESQLERFGERSYFTLRNLGSAIVFTGHPEVIFFLGRKKVFVVHFSHSTIYVLPVDFSSSLFMDGRVGVLRREGLFKIPACFLISPV